MIDYEYRMLTGGAVVPADGAGGGCRLAIDPTLSENEYRLVIDEGIALTGGSYAAVAMGTVTLMQAVRTDDGSAMAPRGWIADEPGSSYRGLMIDVARAWHDIETLEQLVLLARWYKVNRFQLHLTDDQSFTFPTESLPALPTPGRHYTKAQLRALDRFARERGVTLVPEIEVPGHAGQFVARMPETFAIAGGQNTRTINIGRETVYQALDALVAEVADVFTTSPWIHIGGDEARLEHLTEDPDVQRYQRVHDVPNAEELYRHFLVRMDSIVRRHGKRTIVWEGFGPDGETPIPTDILVMAWETMYQLPQELLDAGYTIVNASWKPFYVINEKKWDPETIYGWNLWRWGNWVPVMPSFTPIQIDSTPRVIGASLEAWGQPQEWQLRTLRRRLPAMAERAWTPTVEPRRPVAEFMDALERTDAAFSRVISPIRATADGLRYPELVEGHWHEETWFGDTLVVTLDVPRAATSPSAGGDVVIRYTLDGAHPTPASARYTGPITLDETTLLGARAYDATGRPIGRPLRLEYRLHPVSARIEGRLIRPMDELWELADTRAPFAGTLRIHLSSDRDGTIRYTLDGSPPTAASPAYREPIRLDADAQVRARLFDPAGGPVGLEWAQGFRSR